MQGNETIIPLVGMLVTFGVPVLLVALILWFKHRKLRMTHETIARLAEKGLPVPPELLDSPSGGANRSVALRGGLVLVGLGIALAVFLLQVGGPWSIGLIPGLMGLALVAAWVIEGRQDKSQAPR